MREPHDVCENLSADVIFNGELRHRAKFDFISIIRNLFGASQRIITLDGQKRS